MTAYVPQPPSAGPGRARGSKVLMILGAVVLVVGVIAISVGFAILGNSTSALAERADRIRDQLLVEVEVPGQSEVRLQPGRYYVYSIDPFAVRQDTSATALSDGPDPSDASALDPTVTVTGPDGAPVLMGGAGAGALVDSIGGELLAIDGFRVPAAGTYTVEASGAGADRVGVGRATDVGGTVKRAVGGGLLSLLGFALAGIGAVLALAGLIWFLVSGSSSGPPRPTNWGPPPGPWGPPQAWPPSAWAPPPGPPAAAPPTDHP